MKERQTAVINERGEVRLRTEPVPELKAGEVLIRVKASLISPGTEISGIRARREKPGTSPAENPFGYSVAGIIETTSPSHPQLAVGTRVAAMGGGACHANLVCVPVNLVVPIPDNLPFDQAAYACLGATALQSVRRTEPQLGEYGAVLGLGIVGNLTAQLYQLSGAHVIGWERLPARLERARRCGLNDLADLNTADPVAASQAFAAPYGLDFANVAFGGNADEALSQVVKCMKVTPDTHAMGRIVLVGGCQFTMRGGAAMGNLDIRAASRTGPGYHDDAYEHGQDYPGVFVQFTTQRNLREIVSLCAAGRLHVEPLTTHHLSLAKIEEAVELLLNNPNEAIGVILQAD